MNSGSDATPTIGRRVSALFVESGGCYCGIANVDAWPEARDARLYRGPDPVVAHPPCQRWGRFWHGSTRKPHQFRLGEDSGCFAAALTAVRNYSGILEHPAGSLAWRFFGLRKPKCGQGWIKADEFGGWTCQVDQRHYGHQAPKPTWLYAVGTKRPELIWAKSDRTPPAWMIERYGLGGDGRREGQVQDSQCHTTTFPRSPARHRGFGERIKLTDGCRGPRWSATRGVKCPINVMRKSGAAIRCSA